MRIITSHINPDFDAVSAMMGINKLFPSAKKIIIGTPEKNILRFLTDFSSFFSFYQEKDIDLTDVTELIIVDTHSPKRIGKFKKLIGETKIPVYIYDHHPLKNNSITNAAEYVHKDYGASTTIIVDMLLKKNINITPEEATLFMLGIYEETGGLTFVSTTPADLHIASELLTCGADLTLVSKYLTHKLDEKLTKILSQLLDNLEYITVHGFEICFMTAYFEKYIKDISFLLHKVREIENIGIMFALVEMEGKIYLMARSNHKFVNAGQILKNFGGGGHPSASSAVLKDITLSEAKEKIIQHLYKILKKEYCAKDIMNCPVKTINPDLSVTDAKDYIIKANINSLPVMENNRLSGIITRMDIDKAVFHGLGSTEVKNYMSTHIISVSPDTPLPEIQKKFSINNIGRLPVMENENLIGIITRTDLLRALHDNYLNWDITEKQHTVFHPPLKSISDRYIKKIPRQVLSIILTIGKLADKHNCAVYLVGGFVRDIFLEINNFDIDIVVENKGIEFAKIIAGYYKCNTVSHKKFGTAVIKISEFLKIDVSTARTEYYKYPGALPTVEFSSIKNDLSRRDFTINAMALRITEHGFGELIDFFGGQQDIKNKIIRILHNLSFIEDPTRILRAIRFEQRFGFHIEKHTEHLIKRAVKYNLYSKISYERIRSELINIMNEPKPVKAICRIYEFDEMKFIDPVFCGKTINIGLFEKIEDSLTWFSLSFLKIPIEKWLVYFMGIFSGIEIKYSDRICKKMTLQKKYSETIITSLKQADKAIKKLTSPNQKNSIIYKTLIEMPVEGLLYIMSLSDNPVIREKISFFISHLKDIKIGINGDYLKNKKLPHGKYYKKILNT
ncbi:CBS domain-containing protein, partial [bacterium]|nr:CBS domain-containing protein [bacterium]